MSVWVMPSVIDVYENFLKQSQAVAGGRRRSQAVGTPKRPFRMASTARNGAQEQLLTNALIG